MQSTPLTIANRYLGPILIVLSLVALYRGHNLPGGGFIGGLIAASAVLLRALTHGWEDVRKTSRIDPMGLIVAGLALAMASGLPALWGGETYMTGLWAPALEIPVIGKIKVGTPFLFDIGVYLAVVGFTLKSAIALGLETETEN
jgi:multicomponent Na+:H+ antiporter subunit B